MKRQSIRFVSLLLALAMLLSLSACGEIPDETGPYTLRVLTNARKTGTDAVQTDNMEREIKRLADAFQEDHEGVTVEVEYLPEDPEQRGYRLEQLRTEIMAGNGPDLFLISSYYWYTEYEGAVQHNRQEFDDGLFPDPEQAMYNGLFYDISSLYDADEALNTVALNSSVMDGGVLDGRRYILPIRYNIPVVYADKAALEASGMDVERMKESVTDFYQEILDHGDPNWAASAFRNNYLTYYCPQIFNYKAARVAVTGEEILDYMKQYSAVADLAGDAGISTALTADRYVISGTFPLMREDENDVDRHVCVGGLENAPAMVAVAEANGVEMEMFPLRATDGSLIGLVEWWGAVNAASAHPRGAYELLRGLLLEDSQWEQTRRSPEQSGPEDVGLRARGWPVRTIGSVQPIWEFLTGQLDNVNSPVEGIKERRVDLRRAEVTEADILPLLEAQVDIVRFPIAEYAVFDSAVMRGNYTDSTVQELLDALQLHLDEG